MDPEKTDLQKQLSERFVQLPPVVQRAITSADVEKHLRELATTHKLHIDQWDKLENEVMLTLFGFQRTEDLPTNIAKEVGMDAAAASTLAADISHIVFEPIRQELERQLEHPEAQVAKTSDVDDVRARVLAQSSSVAPATPPPAPPTAKVERAPLPATYTQTAASHERKSIEGDPYREQLV